MELLETAGDVVKVLRENYAPFVAGSLAYSAFVSVLPLLTLAFVAATVLNQQQVVDQALQMTGQYLTGTGRDLFSEALRNSTGRAAVSAFSLVLLLWSGLRVFRGLDTAFSLFYGTEGSQTLIEHLRDALVVFLASTLALLASVGIGAAVTFLWTLPGEWILGPVLLLFPLVVAFLPIYYVFPDTDVTVREVLPGVVTAALGWAVLQSGFRLYASQAGQFQVYGVIGAVMVVLTWLYVAALVLLVGAALNVVLADRTAAALSEAPATTRGSPGK